MRRVYAKSILTMVSFLLVHLYSLFFVVSVGTPVRPFGWISVISFRTKKGRGKSDEYYD